MAQNSAKDINTLDHGPDRKTFFNTIYAEAKGDAAAIPWADLKEKNHLKQWLDDNKRLNFSSTSANLPTAIDIACGLGDNAEALANAGYKTTAFDLSPDAIDWAKQRFPKTKVDYQQADLFALPAHWIDGFDLVHECYTLQALPPEILPKTATSIASLVRPGGTLLVYARVRLDGEAVNGPPWPLQTSDTFLFADLGFELVYETSFLLEKSGRQIKHCFMQWQKN